jgi:hypothetical protein
MAILILGRTKCVICHATLQDQDVEEFPAMFANRLSPLHAFHDAAAHRACLAAHPHGPLALRLRNLRHTQAHPPRCAVCDEVIAIPSELFSTGLICEDETDPAFRFNFVRMHATHFAGWKDVELFREVSRRLLAPERWDGPRLVLDPLPSWEG